VLRVHRVLWRSRLHRESVERRLIASIPAGPNFRARSFDLPPARHARGAPSSGSALDFRAHFRDAMR
jgi:hypothetical protein